MSFFHPMKTFEWQKIVLKWQKVPVMPAKHEEMK